MAQTHTRTHTHQKTHTDSGGKGGQSLTTSAKSRRGKTDEPERNGRQGETREGKGRKEREKSEVYSKKKAFTGLSARKWKGRCAAVM